MKHDDRKLSALRVMALGAGLALGLAACEGRQGAGTTGTAPGPTAAAPAAEPQGTEARAMQDEAAPAGTAEQAARSGGTDGAGQRSGTVAGTLERPVPPSQAMPSDGTTAGSSDADTGTQEAAP